MQDGGSDEEDDGEDSIPEKEDASDKPEAKDSQSVSKLSAHLPVSNVTN